MKTKLIAVKNHIYSNRAKYAMLATASVAYVVHKRDENELLLFLDKHDLVNEFYHIKGE